MKARTELEELQKDKDRLKGRGSAKQLALEEQMAKKIKQLPKIIETLREQTKEWEAAEGTFFCVPAADGSTGGGRPCLDMIDATEDNWGRRKEQVFP